MHPIRLILVLLILSMAGQALAQRKKKQAQYDQYWQEQAQLELYNKQMQEAAELFKQNAYLKAVESYSKAMTIKPNDQLAQSKINDLEIILAARDEEVLLPMAEEQMPMAVEAEPISIDSTSQREPIEATSLATKPFNIAINDPAAAPKAIDQNLKPMPAQQSGAPVQSLPKAAEAPNPTVRQTVDKSSAAYRLALAEKYDSNSETAYKEGSRLITKRIVVQGQYADEYLKVQHGWGGVFYFKNAEPISYQTWVAETDHLF